MKTKFLTLVFIGLFGLTAQAGSTEVCVGKSLIYRSVRSDVGMKPHVGYKLGSLKVSVNNIVIINHDILFGKTTPDIKYFVEFENIQTGLREGNANSGSELSSATALVYKVNPENGDVERIMLKETVVCSKTWRLVF